MSVSYRMLIAAGLALTLPSCVTRGDVDELPNRIVFKNSAVAELTDAAEAGDVAKVVALVRQGADVNARGYANVTPLYRVIQVRNWEGYCALIENGADPNLLDQRGRAVMFEAASDRDPKWLKKALENGGNPNLIDVGTVSHEAITPLFYAVQTVRRPQNLQLLIDAGADLNHQDRVRKETALYRVACASIGYEEAAMLVEAGADFRLKNVAGRDTLDQLRGCAYADDITKKHLERLIAALNKHGAALPPPEYDPRLGSFDESQKAEDIAALVVEEIRQEKLSKRRLGR